jgi:hypothetical protein
MPSSFKFSVALFIEGGLAILEAIRQHDYDVWSSRPTLTRWQKLRLLANCRSRLWRGKFMDRYAKVPLQSDEDADVTK